MNPVNPVLLHRGANRFRRPGRGETTGDTDVVRRCRLLVDIDPVRPAGISATDEEKVHALDKAVEISEGLASMGWPRPIVVDSGNGYYLLYLIDLPADDGGLVHRCLQALQPAADEHVHIDVSVANASRICRVPGTWNCKGEDSPERPHRMAEVVEAPAALAAVPVALLEALAATHAPAPHAPAGARPAPVAGDGGRPGDDYNRRGEIATVLEAHGWQRVGEANANQFWRRPGKATGNHSATFDGHTFYVFSSAAPPFEPNQGYSPFAVYAILEHSGDFTAASAALAARGYGDPRPAEGPDVDIGALVAKARDGSPPNPVSPDAPLQPADPGPLPEGLLHVPGLMAEVMEYTMAHAPTRNRAMAFAGALALMSFLGARKVCDPGGNRTNLYILALALSGSGKDFPRKVNARILREVGQGRAVVLHFGSAESIEDKLCAVPSVLCQTDEFNGVLLMARNSRDPRYDAILDRLKELYTSSDDTFVTRELVSRESREVHQPSVTILGTAVPVHYYNALSEKMLTDGFFSRTIAIEAVAGVTDQEPTLASIPEHIIEVAQWWARFNPGGGNLHDFAPEPLVVPLTDEAANLVIEVRDLARARQDEANARNDAVTATVWSRVRQMTRKLALIYAISADHEHPCIDRAAVEWARDFAVHHAQRMLYMASVHVSESTFHARCLKVVKLLHGAPERTVTRSRVLRYLKCTARELNEIADTLEQQGQILRTEIKSSTKSALAYRLAC